MQAGGRVGRGSGVSKTTRTSWLRIYVDGLYCPKRGVRKQAPAKPDAVEIVRRMRRGNPPGYAFSKMSVLVDSDILIEVSRGRDKELVARWVELSRSNAAVLYSPVNAAELWAGRFRPNTTRLRTCSAR